MTRFRLYLMMILSCSTLLLAGCESDEDKAERFYQSGLALVEQGDIERATIELRNVFDHDGFHKEARLLYAGLVLELGRTQEAYGQYLRLIEQYPDTLEARIALAELALAQNNWPEVERHGAAAFDLAPDRLDVRSIDVAMRYRQAAIDRDVEKRAEIALEAAALLEEHRAGDLPDNDALVRVMIDNHLQSEQYDQALEVVNAALERTPEVEDLNLLKTQLLVQTQDIAGTGTHLKKVVDLFPDNRDMRQMLISWYISEGDLAGAEAFLRAQAGADDGPTDNHVVVIQFLLGTQGADAAQAEMRRLQAANEGTENGLFYAGMLASAAFQGGDRDQAIADMRSILETSEAGTQKTSLQILLARMLFDTGATEEAHALVDTVLETDVSNVAALRMRAARLIDEDKPGEAIVALRAALDQDPRDADTLTLMARAHERDGDTELVGERLALAMEASGNAIPQVLRYAQFLASQDRQQAAVTILEDARRRTPGSVQLILALANLHMQMGNWQQASSAAEELRRIDDPLAAQAAVELTAQILQGQNRTEDSLQMLQEQFSAQTDSTETQKIRAISLIVQTQIKSGKTDAARATLEQALAETPDNPDLRVLSGLLYSIAQQYEPAEAIYRDLMEEYPRNNLPVRLLINLQSGSGRPDDARATLDQALERQPDEPNLLWIKASFLERVGDIEGAIDVYAKLYADNSDSLVVANNYASLITTHRDDPESLTLAANIVRRMRGTDVPQFQDTYGWIAYRRDNFEEAVEYLEPAAAALQGNVLVQYHLGMTYAALGRTDEARTQLEKALEMASDSPLPQLDTARETLAGLE